MKYECTKPLITTTNILFFLIKRTTNILIKQKTTTNINFWTVQIIYKGYEEIICFFLNLQCNPTCNWFLAWSCLTFWFPAWSFELCTWMQVLKIVRVCNDGWIVAVQRGLHGSYIWRWLKLEMVDLWWQSAVK